MQHPVPHEEEAQETWCLGPNVFLFLTLLCVRGLDPGRANDFGFLFKKEAEAWTRFMNFPGKMLYGCGPASELHTAVQMAKDMRN